MDATKYISSIDGSEQKHETIYSGLMRLRKEKAGVLVKKGPAFAGCLLVAFWCDYTKTVKAGGQANEWERAEVEFVDAAH